MPHPPEVTPCAWSPAVDDLPESLGSARILVLVAWCTVSWLWLIVSLRPRTLAAKPRLIRVPGRLNHHAGQFTLRLSPGRDLLANP